MVLGISRRRRVGLRRSSRPRVEILEGRQLLAAPVIEPIGSVVVPGGKSLFVPIRGSDADGDPISYVASSNVEGVQVDVRAGNPSLRMTVESFGVLEFQLLDDLASNTVERISGLVNQGFYDGLTFHRVIPDFVIQGGDPAGNGTGGPGFQFDDEFNPLALFTGNGQLAMANSGKDTNGSQFFVTLGPQRSLDFNHTIFGQLVRGFDVAEAIANVPRGANDRPITPVVISDAEVVTNSSDAVLLVRAGPGSGPATITLTASDGTGESSVESFQVNVTADTSNSPPILGPIGNQATIAGTPLNFSLSSTDLEGDPVEYQAILQSNADRGTASVVGNQVTITPLGDFTGSFSVLVGVKQAGATSRGSTANPFDTQVITVTVTPPTLQSEGIPVAAAPGTNLFNVPVARFESTGSGPATDYSATISWGDGTSSNGTIVSQGTGRFEVRGSHTFASAGNFPILISVTGPGVSASETSTTATVSATQQTTVGVTVIGSPGTVAAGTNSAFLVDVRNSGNATARNVTLDQLLPTSFTFVSSSIAPSSQAEGVVTINLGDLDPGENQTLTIIVSTQQVGTFSSTGRVTGEGFLSVTDVGSITVVAPTTPIDPTPEPGENPARVVDLQRFGIGFEPTLIVLTFDSPIDPSLAEDVSNYQLRLPGKDGRMGTRHDLFVPIDRATYDEATMTVTLEPRFRVPYLPFARLEVRSGPNGLADVLGRPIDGNSDGQAGGAFISRFGRGVYLDRSEVLRGSEPAPRSPLRLIVRTGGQSFEGAAIAPLFRGQPEVFRYLAAAGLADLDGGSIAPDSTLRPALAHLPRGPRELIRRVVPQV